jgi:SAM-dependent methyltransferase
MVTNSILNPQLTYGIGSTKGSLATLSCNACGEYSLKPESAGHFRVNRQGNHITLQWFWCSKCGSCFCGNGLSEDDEITHHKTREHGRLDGSERCHLLKQTLYEYICEGLMKRGLSRKKVLDVGASFGGFVRVAREKEFETSATDLNPDCVKYLQSNGFKAFRSLSLGALDLPDSSFDAITMLDVSYYFRNQKLEFENAERLLKPGGLLVVRTTNKSWAIWVSTILMKIRPAWAQRLFRRAVVDHAFVQSVGSLRRLLKECGYDKVIVEPDRTHLQEQVSWDAKVAYLLGTILSFIIRRPVLVPGVIVWARTSK